MRSALGALVLGLAFAPSALAADPPTGTVSRVAPALVWKGSATGSPFIWADIALASQRQAILCSPAFCDTFHLEVADAADLRIESSSCEDDVTAIEVERPDGSRLFADGLEGSPRTFVDLVQAPPGTYVVRTLVNVPPSARGAYIGHATLAVPPARATLTAASRRVRAARMLAGRRIRIALAGTSRVTHLRAVLRDVRNSVVGSGRLAALDGTGSLSVRLARALRPGVYRVSVTGDDGAGAVEARAAVRVVRRRPHARTSRVGGTVVPAPADVPAHC